MYSRVYNSLSIPSVNVMWQVYLDYNHYMLYTNTRFKLKLYTTGLTGVYIYISWKPTQVICCCCCCCLWNREPYVGMSICSWEREERKRRIRITLFASQFYDLADISAKYYNTHYLHLPFHLPSPLLLRLHLFLPLSLPLPLQTNKQTTYYSNKRFTMCLHYLPTNSIESVCLRFIIA